MYMPANVESYMYFSAYPSGGLADAGLNSTHVCVCVCFYSISADLSQFLVAVDEIQSSSTKQSRGSFIGDQ